MKNPIFLFNNGIGRPGGIPNEYRTTRFPARFYILKIGVLWADLERRLDIMSVMEICSEAP